MFNNDFKLNYFLKTDKNFEDYIALRNKNLYCWGPVCYLSLNDPRALILKNFKAFHIDDFI